MDLLNPESNSIWINGAIVIVAAALVWMGGSQLARHAKTISEQTGAGQEFLGALLLGGIASLPELAMAAAAAHAGSAALAASILLGGIAITMVALAVADSVIGRKPITTKVQKPVVLVQS